MRRAGRTTAIAAACAGLLAGVVVTLVATDPTHDAGGAEGGASAPRSSVASTTSTPTTLMSSPSGSSGADVLSASTTLLVWVSGGVPTDLGARLAPVAPVDEVTTVYGAQTAMVRSAGPDGSLVDEVAPGWAIPLDTLAVDPPSFGLFVEPGARAAIRDLRPGQALLPESSARFRKLGIGATIGLRTGTVEIVGVIDDHSGAGAELVVHRDDARRLGVATPRYLLVRHEAGSRRAVTDAVADLVGPSAIRYRTPAETTWLRHGDAVTPQVFIKEVYGEFAYSDVAGRDVEIDPAWIEEHIVEADVPILGTVRCHREMIEPLAAALSVLADANLGHLVDPRTFAGCWSPRRIAEGQPLSRHAWGIAVDLNIESNPRGSFSNQDARLVDAMRTAGFTWGGLWLVPDPGHYELAPG